MKVIEDLITESQSLPCNSAGKATACNAGDLGSILGSGSSPGEGNGNPLQYSCLENPGDIRIWQPMVHRIIRVIHDLARSFFFLSARARAKGRNNKQSLDQPFILQMGKPRYRKTKGFDQS